MTKTSSVCFKQEVTVAWSGKDPNTTEQACSAFSMLFNLYLLEVRHQANGWKDGALDERASENLG